MNFLAFISRAGFVCGEEKVDRGEWGLHWAQGIVARGGHKARSVTRPSTVVGCQRISFFVVDAALPHSSPCLFKWRPPSATTHSGVAVRAMRQARSVGGGSGVERGWGGGFIFEAHLRPHNGFDSFVAKFAQCFEIMFCV